MNVQIDVGEIVIDGVSISEPQLFELRLALERQLTERFESLGGSSIHAYTHQNTVVHSGTGGTTQQLATQVASSIHEAAILRPRDPNNPGLASMQEGTLNRSSILRIASE